MNVVSGQHDILLCQRVPQSLALPFGLGHGFQKNHKFTIALIYSVQASDRDQKTIGVS